jgi:sugar phosphate isomerase/epimerase/catechol 2,3-dioxygenase-like lactoylglutathione lyase family enzyme
MWRGLADLLWPEYVDYCQKAKAEVMEISGWPKSYGGGLKFDDAGVELARSLTRKAGIEICAVGSPDDFVQATPEGFEDQVKLVKGYVDLAVKLGASVVSLKVGTPKEGIATEDAINLIVDGLKRVAPYAQASKVFLALENRSTLTNNTDILLRILKEVRSLYVRVLLDTGNFLQYGYSPDEVIKAVDIVAPYTVHTHLKDGRGHKKEFKPAALGAGEIDIEQVLRILKVNGYLHPMCVQYEGPDQPGVYVRDVQYTRERTGNWEIGSDGKQSMARGLHHVSISMKDFKTAYEFYGEVLGLPVTTAQGISFSPVMLFQLPTGEQFHVHLGGPSTHCHVAIEVVDFAATVGRLKQAGIQITQQPNKRGDGSDFLFCKDPHGNTIEITHHYSWQDAKLFGE